MKLIPLTQGYFAQVDDEDFDWLNQWKWCANIKNGKVYAKRTSKGILMHRVILGITDPKIKVDHEDLTGNNNQRSNLRASTNSQNCANRLVDKRSTTGFKGVSKKPNGRFRAYIVKEYKQIVLGYSDCPKTCARTYNKAAKELFGGFASLNIVEDGPLCIETILPITNTSGLLGVRFNENRGRWSFRIWKGKIGYGKYNFTDAMAAAKAYDAKAKELYGPDYKKLNFPTI